MDETPEELEKYFSTYKEFFLTAGWKVLEGELLDTAKTIDSVQDCSDSSDLFYRKGQLNILTFLLNLEESLLKAEDLVEEAYSESIE